MSLLMIEFSCYSHCCQTFPISICRVIHNDIVLLLNLPVEFKEYFVIFSLELVNLTKFLKIQSERIYVEITIYNNIRDYHLQRHIFYDTWSAYKRNCILHLNTGISQKYAYVKVLWQPPGSYIRKFYQIYLEYTYEIYFIVIR